MRVSEDHSLNPSTYYGKMKIICSSLCKEFYSVKKIKFYWLRLYDTYGPGDNPTGSLHTL